ncbi:MAG: hypothetical protein ACOYJK_03680 [Prevotella sp.]|jgi:hypothetical protein
MILQYIITGIVILVCVVIAAYRIYRTVTDTSSACDGCQLKELCTRHARKQKLYPDGCSRKHKS